jgi:hypothetical protein
VATQALFLTLSARRTQIVICVNQDKSREYRNDENSINLGIVFLWNISLMPGVLEKGIVKNFRYSYPEPTLVPLGEKPQV